MDGGSTAIVLAGEYDLSNTGTIDGAIARELMAGARQIVVDMAGVPLSLANPTGRVLRLLRIAGLERAFSIPAGPGGEHLDVAARIRRAVAGAGGSPALLPTVLAHACARALNVDGAGLSLIQGQFRIPIGATDEAAALAESLQFTFGEGPCLEAAMSQEAAAVGMAEMARRWPELAHEMAARTPFRAVVALPLRIGGSVLGSMDLYLEDPAVLQELRLAEALAAANEAAGALQADAMLTAWDAAEPEAIAQPGWLAAPQAGTRGNVWIAIGILMQRTSAPAPDLLARLRGYAYSEGLTADQVSTALVTGALDAGHVISDR